MPTYEQALETARGLLSEQIRDPVGEANPEYVRGIVELLADLYGTGQDDRDEVLDDLGLPMTAIG